MSKKHTCRWWACEMDVCRHPKYYEEMRKLGIFFEPSCNARSKSCEYEKCDETHPMWYSEADGTEDEK